MILLYVLVQQVEQSNLGPSLGLVVLEIENESMTLRLCAWEAGYLGP